MNRPGLLRTGWIILALSAVGLLFASVGITTPSPDLQSKIGRHVLAGGLANAALAVALFLIAIHPIRRGERWALLPFVASLVLYGIPILIIDATHVAPARLFRTLAPQVTGILFMVAGLVLVVVAMFSSPRRG